MYLSITTGRRGAAAATQRIILWVGGVRYMSSAVVRGIISSAVVRGIDSSSRRSRDTAKMSAWGVGLIDSLVIIIMCVD